MIDLEADEGVPAGTRELGRPPVGVYIPDPQQLDRDVEHLFDLNVCGRGGKCQERLERHRRAPGAVGVESEIDRHIEMIMAIANSGKSTNVPTLHVPVLFALA